MSFYVRSFQDGAWRMLLLFLLLISCFALFATVNDSARGSGVSVQAQSPNTDTADRSWVVNSFIWNQEGNIWARTNCTMTVGGLGSSVSGELAQSSCNNAATDKKLSFVQYYHDIDPDDTTPLVVTDDVYGKLKGRAWSPLYGVIYFDMSDFPSSGSSCYGLTTTNRQARIRRSGGEVLLTGCAYVPLLRDYILFNTFGTTDSSVPSSGWDGVSVITVENAVSAYLTLYGCAWSSKNGFWSFGPNQSSASNKTNCLPSTHNTELKKVLSESHIGSPGGVLVTVNPTRASAKIGQEIGYQYACPDGYATPSLRIGSRNVSTTLSPFHGSHREIFTDPVDTLLLTCIDDRTGVFTVVRKSSGAIASSVQDSFFISSFTATPAVLTEGGFVSFGGRVSNQGGFSSRVSPPDTTIGHCDNAVHNGCVYGTANEAVVADDATYFKWRCDGESGIHSGTCQIVKPNSYPAPIQQKIVASDRNTSDWFGYSVAISGDTAIVGASFEDHDSIGGAVKTNAGAAYIFTKSGSTWTQQKIVASDRGTNDQFGRSVAISGDTAIVGAYAEDHDSIGGAVKTDAGAAYIFTKSGSTWTQQKIVASDRNTNDWFGYSVAISGDTAIVGASLEDHDSNGAAFKASAGAAYIFTKSGSTWTQQKIVASDRGTNDQFGRSVAISGDTAIVGAYAEDHDSIGGAVKTNAGAAYIFTKSGSTWTQQKIVASDRGTNDQFGRSVAISGDTAIVGAYAEDHDSIGGAVKTNAGAAYIFTKSGSTWTQQKIVASDRGTSDLFGSSVAISGDTAIVGARYEDHDSIGGAVKTNAGAAYIFTKSGSTWTQQKIVASDRGTNDQFGRSVAISGDTAIVGASLEDHDSNGAAFKASAGAAYTFALPDVGLCNNTMRNGCAVGTANDATIVDTPTHYRWQCDGVNGGGNSGACQFSKTSTPGNEGYCTIANKVTKQKVGRFDVGGVNIPISGSDLAVQDAVYELACQYKKFTADGVFDKWRSIATHPVAVKVLPQAISERNVSDSVALPVFSELATTVQISIPPKTAMVYVYRLDDSSAVRIDPDSLYKVFIDRDVVELNDDEDTVDALIPRLFESTVRSKVSAVTSGLGKITKAAVVGKSLVAVARTAEGAWSQQVVHTPSAAGICAKGRNRCVIGTPNDGAVPDDAASYKWRCDGTGGGQPSKICQISRTSITGECAQVATGITPTKLNACFAGLFNDVESDANFTDTTAFYRWRCDGVGGAPDSNVCESAKPQNGSCNNTKRNSCIVGTPNDTAVDDTATHHRWRCDGLKGGSISDTCSVSRLVRILATDKEAGDMFGHSVSLDGTTALIGAPEEDAGATNAGAAYIFTYSDGVWIQQQKILAGDAGVGDKFGSSVSLDGDTALIGAPGEGAAYIFTRVGNSWSQQRKIVSADAGTGDEFGFSVALGGDTALIGAYAKDTGVGGAVKADVGAAYIFTRVGNSWAQLPRVQKIQAGDIKTYARFGYSVALDGTTALIGASVWSSGRAFPLDPGFGKGAVYSFTRVGDSWVQQGGRIQSDDGFANQRFGSSVSLDGDTALIGASLGKSAYIFTRVGNSWSQQRKVVQGDFLAYGLVGSSVSLDGDTALVGAPVKEFYARTISAVYIFTRSGNSWAQSPDSQDISARKTKGVDLFGSSVSLDGDIALIGAPKEDPGTNAGAAYIFSL